MPADPLPAARDPWPPEIRHGTQRRQAVILTAGRASRIAVVSQGRPKGLIEYAGKPVLVHQVLQLVQSGIDRIVIVHAPGANDELRGLMDRVFSGAGVEFVFAEQPAPDGPGRALAAAVEVLQDDDTLLLLADTVIEGLEDLAPDTVGVARVQSPHEFCIALVAPDRTVTEYQDKPTSPVEDPVALIGVYRFAGGAFLRDILADMATFVNGDISEVLCHYGKRYPLRAVPMRGWRDLGSYDRYVTANRDSIVGRSAHTFATTRDGGVVKRGGPSLIRAQLDWYGHVPERAAALAPRVLSADLHGHAYRTELCDYPSLASLLLYENLGVQAWNFVLGELLGVIEEALWAPTRQNDPSLGAWCDRKYTAKTLGRLERWEPWVTLRERPMRVNGIWVPAFDELWPAAAQALDRLAKSARESCFIHGDMTFSNILMVRHYCMFKLIDPGTSFSETQRGDVRYDLAKLRQSYAGGYDIYREGLFRLRRTGADEMEVRRFPRLAPLAPIGDELISQRGHDLNEIRLLEAIQFLSMVPLHHECPDRQLALYLRGLHLLEAFLEGNVDDMRSW